MRTMKDGTPGNEGQDDKLIDETLRVLATQRLPVGMQERLQRRLQTHQAEPAQRTETSRLARIMRIAAPLAAAAVLALLIVTHRRMDHVRTGPVIAALSAQPRSADVPGGSMPAKEQAVSLRPVAREHILHIAQTQVALPRTPIQEVSIPAPPAPLTEQEKLLLVLARHSESSSSPEVAALLISERVIQHGLAPEPPLPASPTTSE